MEIIYNIFFFRLICSNRKETAFKIFNGILKIEPSGKHFWMKIQLLILWIEVKRRIS